MEEIEKLKAELLEANQRLVKAEQSNNALVQRGLQVKQEIEMYKASPALAAQMAEMEFQLKMAKQFIASKAFNPNITPEQAYVLIKAGNEMGMQPVESMQALYIVNGAVKYWGDKMAAKITKAGYKIEYLNETASGVTVRVTNKEGFEAKEVVTDQDQILQRSKAAGFAKKNKMRFHGIRMVASFHLPHLFGSVQDEFTSDFTEWQEDTPQLKSGIDLKQIDNGKEKARVLDHINKSKSMQELKQVLAYAEEFELTEQYNAKLITMPGHEF